jgi:hypothetical protein
MARGGVELRTPGPPSANRRQMPQYCDIFGATRLLAVARQKSTAD